MERSKLKWISCFMEQHKRKPKILHIGNIANNAYQNAKMLNMQGCDCDVLSVDYYHVNACPEWADAEFEEKIENSNFPNWNKIDLHGFKRPKWFVAGPLELCIKYLHSRRDKNIFKKYMYWRKLEIAREEIAEARNCYHYSDYFRKQKKEQIRLDKLNKTIEKRNHRRMILMKFPFSHILLYIDDYIYSLKKLVKRITEKEKIEIKVKKYEEIVEDFKIAFPEKKCEFDREFLVQFIELAKKMKVLMDKYDIVVGYATNPIIPYLACLENYVAYEHGTIRNDKIGIAKDDDFTRLYMLAYAKANVIYSTNVDCYESAKYLVKHTKTPIVCGLHGIDINGIIRKNQRAKEMGSFSGRLGIDRGTTMFFCPSRHDYDIEQKVFLKGEEKMLNATYRLAKEKENFILVLVEWGNDCNKIKGIIEKYDGLKKHIMWIKPLKQMELFRVYQETDAVLDQFFWPVYGGITFEVMASGGVLISNSANKDYTLNYFGDTLPYFSCEDERAIYNAMREVMEKSDRYSYYKNKSYEWVQEYHSNKKIVNVLCQAFQYCINR